MQPMQWAEISTVMKEKGHFPFFDMAYQGFASGDCVKDAQAISIFLKDGHELGCSQSYAKNMGLYGQRTGVFSIVTNDKNHVSASLSSNSCLPIWTALFLNVFQIS